MGIKIHAQGDAITIGKAFVSGKDRITVNEEVMFEGKIEPDTPQRFSRGNRQYSIETRVISKLTGATVTLIQIAEESKVIHSCFYNINGQPVKSVAESKHTGALQICGVVGGVLGFATMMLLNILFGAAAGAVGGALGGAIGGGVGYGVGYGIGSLFIKEK